jgi:hypothetical protein
LLGINLADLADVVGKYFYIVLLQGVSSEVNLNSGSGTTTPRRSCGKCEKAIKLRESAGAVLCTATLEIVEAGIENVCEHFEERSKNPVQTCF